MPRLLRWLLLTAAAVLVAVLLARSWFVPADPVGRAPVSAIAASGETPLGRLMLAGSAAHPGRSGVLALRDPRDALASRLALIEAARVSIDVQYYIWHADASGSLLLAALLDAAQRGVRVRLLLDDIGVSGMDGLLAALDAQPNVEVRLFNPSLVRRPKLISYLFDFARMNRRMHNKALIADGAAAIVGGRNIGDEYFQVGQGVFFHDLDVLATGAVIAETSAAFDAYWNSRSVLDVDHVLDKGPGLRDLRRRLDEITRSADAEALRKDPTISSRRYAAGELPLEWTRVRLVVDDPAKGHGEVDRSRLMIAQLGRLLGDMDRSLDLVSAYFVPAGAGLDYLTGLRSQGRRVRVLTNAMSATDVLVVHAGYAKFRRDLLRAGVELFELKPFGPDTRISEQQVQPLGISGASLHTKAFALDRDRIFIGSFNFDPRSALFNCEMGFLIESSSMAERMAQAFGDRMLEASYQPRLWADGTMVWDEPMADGSVRTHQTEPGTRAWQRAVMAALAWLPIEWLL
ncbi:MAG: phospholipase D family protein [Burkholderiaceae bacterium]